MSYKSFFISILSGISSIFACNEDSDNRWSTKISQKALPKLLLWRLTCFSEPSTVGLHGCASCQQLSTRKQLGILTQPGRALAATLKLGGKIGSGLRLASFLALMFCGLTDILARLPSVSLQPSLHTPQSRSLPLAP
jgi:hypothetical protein